MKTVMNKLNISQEEQEILNLEILKVTIDKDTMDMFIELKADSLLEKGLIKKISNLFAVKLEDFNISITPVYQIKGSIKDKIEFYKPKILESICENIKSSASWREQLEVKLEDETIYIYPPNEMALYMMERNGLRLSLIDKIKDEMKIDINIKISRSNIKEEVNYLEDKVLEEQKIAQKAMAERPDPVKKGSARVLRNYKFGKNITGEKKDIGELTSETGTCFVEGKFFGLESRELRNGRVLVSFNISDKTGSTTAKIFMKSDESEEFLINVKNGGHGKVAGYTKYDEFSRCSVIMIRSLELTEERKRMDNSEEKRVELHLHTKMSSLDAMTDVKELIKTAEKWGHKAIAITDHGVVQAFPEAMDVEVNSEVKVIYGMEGYLIDDDKDILTNYNNPKDVDSYVVFDLETTGLSVKNDMITEIGAIKIKDGEVVDTFSQLINPERRIPEFIVNLTGITDAMVRDKPTIDEVVGPFKEFIEGSILVAHNASFDLGFIREKFKKSNLEVINPVIDTLELSRAVFPDLKNHKLGNIAKHLKVNLENAHRAVDDAKATSEIFIKILNLLKINDINQIGNINRCSEDSTSIKDRPYHVVVLAKNLEGLKNLYRLVSESHMKYFYRQPRIPKSLLKENREGLLISPACSSGELYNAILMNERDQKLDEIVRFYDYLEIQPTANNNYLLRNGMIKSETELQEINKKIYELGKKHNKLVVATGDVHFLDPEDSIYRTILMAGQGFTDAEEQPPLHFKTTTEMLEDFSYLGPEIAREVVIENPNKISDKVEDISPIPKGTFPPEIEGSDEDLRNMTYKRAYELYGDPLPEIVEQRLERELTSIIENNYSVMYIISQKLVWKSVEDGYLVGSRGSVGSSFAATMSEITEINPLKPHYLCPECKYSEFFMDGEVSSGADLEDADCPECGTKLIKEGHDIPFEVFLGFEGDKEPDIDLNFASEYQPKAHEYTEEIFGEGYVFRAGTIGTIAERTAFGFVKKYYDSIDMRLHPAETNRLVEGCTGVRRSSGQHPGGVMIVPHYKDILDFSPIQYPANDSTSGVITTHFDYDAISSNILKLDILGHDVPTIIKMLEDFTGEKSTEIALDEPKTMALFSGTESLEVDPKDINCAVGTLGIPEFGTRFVRQMLVDTKPNTFSELVRISGLSHGTDVWLNNAQELVRDKGITLSEVISTREDIMLNLISAGMDKSRAFNIMENVRRGRGLSDEDEEYMRELNVKEWYIESCNKIKYMFPKAHAAAYVMMSFRIAFYKVYYPKAFYATYFTTKADDFDADVIVKGKEEIREMINNIESLGFDATAKERNLLTVLEVALEMYVRGYEILPVDLYESDSDIFKIVGEKILPPLKCLEGLGSNAAKSVVVERKKSPFLSKEDLLNRTGVSRPTLEVLTNHGCLEGLPESNQLDFFG